MIVSTITRICDAVWRKKARFYVPEIAKHDTNTAVNRTRHKRRADHLARHTFTFKKFFNNAWPCSVMIDSG